MDSYVSGKDEIWFLRVCHHVPHELYYISQSRDAEWRNITCQNIARSSTTLNTNAPCAVMVGTGNSMENKTQTKHVHPSLSNHRVTFSGNDSWPDAPIQENAYVTWHVAPVIAVITVLFSGGERGKGGCGQAASLSFRWTRACTPKFFTVNLSK